MIREDQGDRSISRLILNGPFVVRRGESNLARVLFLRTVSNLKSMNIYIIYKNFLSYTRRISLSISSFKITILLKRIKLRINYLQIVDTIGILNSFQISAHVEQPIFYRLRSNEKTKRYQPLSLQDSPSAPGQNTSH